MKLLGRYKNGNYTVSLYDDGTKVRCNGFDEFIPDRPESIDLKVTNRCSGTNCGFCHEDSGPDGAHGDILNLPFLDTMLPFSEIAIGGGNPMEHPDLIQFLYNLKEKNLIANMTVNQYHFFKYQERIYDLYTSGLIHGLGVSVQYANASTLALLQNYPNAVAHVINGVVEIEHLEAMYDLGLKLLILGYKDFRRGAKAHNALTDWRMRQLYDALPTMQDHFEVISFDNLAIKQLEPQRLLSEEEWREFYMGDDGQYTMYIDAVKREFAKSSTSEERWPLMDDIKPMFERIRACDK